jgi:outer membrane protein assembly factor BamE (lipoprotein component of BamABCDE complex)
MENSLIKGWFALMLCLTVIFFWTACQTTPFQDFTKVQNNMTKDEVLNLLGSPLRTERRDGKEKWAYRFWSGDDKNVENLRQVTFFNGKVVSFGEDVEEEKRLKQIQDDDSDRVARRNAAKAKALKAEIPASQDPQVEVQVTDPAPAPDKVPIEEDFIEQSGSNKN